MPYSRNYAAPLTEGVVGGLRGVTKHMDGMREMLRGHLGRSLRDLRDEDRLAAAWTVACGRPMADRGAVVGYSGGVVRVEVADAVWMRQMMQLRGVLERDMAKIAGLPVSAIHFEVKRP